MFFFNISFKNYFRNNISQSNSLDQDRARQFVGSDLGSKWLLRFYLKNVNVKLSWFSWKIISIESSIKTSQESRRHIFVSAVRMCLKIPDLYEQTQGRS